MPFRRLEISADVTKSIIPLTVGDHGMHLGDAGFVCVFGQEGLVEYAMEFLTRLKKSEVRLYAIAFFCAS